MCHGGLVTNLDGFARTMELGKTDMRKLWLQGHVWRIPSKAGPRNPVLYDVESFDHNARYAQPAFFVAG